MNAQTRARLLQQPRTKYSWQSALILHLALVAGCTDGTAPLPGPDSDIGERLRAIDGMLAVEELGSGDPDYRQFALVLAQPVDHDDPQGPFFGQAINLLHRAEDAPTVLVSTGYEDYLSPYRSEPTYLLGANQLVVEHRYFADSRPETTDWQYLTIAQAAADHHRVVAALTDIYPGAWVSTGVSKGGMASIYHRRFYPDDVEATIAYVTPISFAAPDARYLPFFATVGDQSGHGACRERLRDLQRAALMRRAELLPLAAEHAATWGDTYDRVGGLEIALEMSIGDLQWGFWQYLGTYACPDIPDVAASAEDILAFVNQVGSTQLSSDEFIESFGPYYYQAATELGYPQSDLEHILDLLTADVAIDAYLPPGTVPDHDPAPMLDIAEWARTDMTRTAFIYGQYDPWTAGAFDIADNQNAHIFVTPEGAHGASIAALPQFEADALAALVESWTGVPMATPADLSNARRAPARLMRPRPPPRTAI